MPVEIADEQSGEQRSDSSADASASVDDGRHRGKRFLIAVQTWAAAEIDGDRGGNEGIRPVDHCADDKKNEDVEEQSGEGVLAEILINEHGGRGDNQNPDADQGAPPLEAIGDNAGDDRTDSAADVVSDRKTGAF